jgi:hypothetical protein
MLMMEPNFVSSWYDMKAQAGTNTTLLSIEHGLGETPLLVDVQVLGKNGRVFPGSGNKDMFYSRGESRRSKPKQTRWRMQPKVSYSFFMKCVIF